MIEVAPTIRSVRSCRFPRFDIAPSLSFPPLDCALGVSPVQAAKSRAVAKSRASTTDVRTVAAMRGPTPGMLIRRLASGSFLTATKISLSSFSMRVVSSSICSANRIRAKRAAPGILLSFSSRRSTKSFAMLAMPVPAVMPNSAIWARRAFAVWLRCLISISRVRKIMLAACCSAVFTGTNRIVGRLTASQMASASAASVLFRLT
jgi:hypothetical protein